MLQHSSPQTLLFEQASGPSTPSFWAPVSQRSRPTSSGRNVPQSARAQSPKSARAASPARRDGSLTPWRHGISPTFCYYDTGHFATVTDTPGGGAVISHRRAVSPAVGDAAFGMLLRKGIHRFTFTVTSAPADVGAVVCFGVADATYPDQMHSARAWGVRPDGTLEAVSMAVGGTTQGLGNLFDASNASIQSWGGVPQSSLSVPGTRVMITCDISERTLSFSIDGAPSTIAFGVTLPSAVRPWIRVASKDVSVKLDAHRNAASSPTCACIRIHSPGVTSPQPHNTKYTNHHCHSTKLPWLLPYAWPDHLMLPCAWPDHLMLPCALVHRFTEATGASAGGASQRPSLTSQELSTPKGSTTVPASPTSVLDSASPAWHPRDDEGWSRGKESSPFAGPQAQTTVNPYDGEGHQRVPGTLLSPYRLPGPGGTGGQSLAHYNR